MHELLTMKYLYTTDIKYKSLLDSNFSIMQQICVVICFDVISQSTN